MSRMYVRIFMTQGPKFLSVFATSQSSWFLGHSISFFLAWEEVRYCRFSLEHAIYFTKEVADSSVHLLWDFVKRGAPF